ncbi:deoxyribodipyrimidine photolyase [Calidifontimicrobium sp. SYSU G02091]|uniref:FAD-binding domain-containing protein n=1 Tax=Calidifontimicrobium sp. SYSU G02091 TaxID=2926421 RepID=UPI001F5309A8|nr:FAD-binding domain-containing protein [Calidifontimicrobium sp. SYSU G02091]MCI1191715.1 deoxyribodipyrimidine photolyase [Calidifontimicrobium sp. SYSU G02091]
MVPDDFPPTLDAARARLAAIRPDAYARTRNRLDGAVTRLSPYLTHGFLTLRDVAAVLAERHALPVQHKLVYELGWRAYFRHAWRHLGDGIFASLHPGPLPDAAYARELPADVREARTGVPVVDEAVRTLYATGWLHNHARLWLASYLVHLRKVHWKAGADWLYAHLLDGDLASNHLSWQWVAGTGSHKPYLFNADNVAKYAPPAWHSPGSVLDAGYDALERLAGSPQPVPATPRADGVAEPRVWHEPPDDLDLYTTPNRASVAGRDVWLVQPWALRAPPPDLPAGTVRVAVCEQGFHRRWGWSERRWRFVATRMAALADHLWWVGADDLRATLAAARSVRSAADPHLGALLDGVAALDAEPALFAEPPRRCASFSQYWARVSRGVSRLDELLSDAG